ncbi:MAG: carbohydrate ABC transporter permease [Chloroflexi bacterium]|nr:carbohydrate ABC transporter permease [Chloroflexota bacterium]
MGAPTPLGPLLIVMAVAVRPVTTPRIPLATVLVYVALIAGAVVMLYPFAYMISTSLKAPAQVYLFPPRWIPAPIQWSNYPAALGRMGFRPFFNSFFFTAAVVLGQGLVTAMGGYAFARLKFPARNVLFIAYLGTMMIPAVVVSIPLFVIVARLGWQDTYQGLIVPILASGAFGTFLFRQFFMTVPEELGDAATVDGANALDIFWRIYLPLSKPALTAYGVITALSAWNLYLWPLIVLQSDEFKPVTLIIAQFSSSMNTQLNLMMAAVAISLLPIFVLYVLGQRFFVEGIAMTGLKG